MSAKKDSPNIVIVVMDCMRADVFDEMVSDGKSTPFLSSLRDEVLRFSRAVAPASWTTPSHASLFTGLYPWVHGAHYKSGAVLTSEAETLAGFLRHSGYSTASLSANGHIQPATGLTRGFEFVKWGGSREVYFRFLRERGPSCPDLSDPGTLELNLDPWMFPIFDIGLKVVAGIPQLWTDLNRLGAKLLDYSSPNLSVAPWIERHLETWLSCQASSRPVFVFVNLLEAHEPYLCDSGTPLSFPRWISNFRLRQSSGLWLRGLWEPSSRELDWARHAFRRSLVTMDGRLRRIVDVLAQHGRWENTLFVLTSDHGQAFLENGTLYHQLRVDEPITRIPLWIRAPGARIRGQRDKRWVSLVDIPRTAASLVGRGSFGDRESLSLLEPEDGVVDRPVYSMTDGLGREQVSEIPPERRVYLDRIEVAAYQGNVKAIADTTRNVRLFDVSESGPLAVPPSLQDDPKKNPVAELSLKALDLATSGIASRPYQDSVKRRLAGWGY